MAESAAERHRAVSAAFTVCVERTTDWAAPTPVEGWTARDVVGHLTDWFPAFLQSGSGVRLPPGPGVDGDPVATWRGQCEAVQQLLEGPDAVFDHPMVGRLDLATAIDRLYISDVFMHTWDLARATGQDDRLDPDLCRELLDGMLGMEEALRGSGHYGPLVPVPEDAGPQARLLGFIGRDPGWQPPALGRGAGPSAR